MKKAIIIQADDWEGLFVDGYLVAEGHTLNDGESRIKVLVRFSKKYNFDIAEIEEFYIEEEDEEILEDLGCFPESLDWLYGLYSR